ncbi:hypothetical protein K503DRAFT_784405 [Rhizopogon vinicolor AM-OR11-026]|uniref:Uncharacterized protein n=1 Tax=Rhizopogon vinicolor AM-OR11-026 TaxID=1314800 RepID=A0A1B7MUT3_9AGAM|nr:hypothetical protein K503DRAFT_784405 [Rhizopogon vinicolor AM-OR11-026]
MVPVKAMIVDRLALSVFNSPTSTSPLLFTVKRSGPYGDTVGSGVVVRYQDILFKLMEASLMMSARKRNVFVSGHSDVRKLLVQLRSQDTHEHSTNDPISNNDTDCLEDIRVQDTSVPAAVPHEEKSREVSAFFGQPYAHKAKDRKTRIARFARRKGV